MKPALKDISPKSNEKAISVKISPINSTNANIMQKLKPNFLLHGHVAGDSDNVFNVGDMKNMAEVISHDNSIIQEVAQNKSFPSEAANYTPANKAQDFSANADYSPTEPLNEEANASPPYQDNLPDTESHSTPSGFNYSTDELEDDALLAKLTAWAPPANLKPLKRISLEAKEDKEPPLTNQMPINNSFSAQEPQADYQREEEYDYQQPWPSNQDNINRFDAQEYQQTSGNQPFYSSDSYNPIKSRTNKKPQNYDTPLSDRQVIPARRSLDNNMPPPSALNNRHNIGYTDLYSANNNTATNYNDHSSYPNYSDNVTETEDGDIRDNYNPPIEHSRRKINQNYANYSYDNNSQSNDNYDNYNYDYNNQQEPINASPRFSPRPEAMHSNKSMRSYDKYNNDRVYPNVQYDNIHGHFVQDQEAAPPEPIYDNEENYESDRLDAQNTMSAQDHAYQDNNDNAEQQTMEDMIRRLAYLDYKLDDVFTYGIGYPLRKVIVNLEFMANGLIKLRKDGKRARSFNVINEAINNFIELDLIKLIMEAREKLVDVLNSDQEVEEALFNYPLFNEEEGSSEWLSTHND